MKALNYQTGKIGEEMARQYLANKGYQIVASNFRTRFGEIDLVAAKDKKLIFVEVKTKIGDQFGDPEEMIDKRKLGKIQIMAEVFLQNHSQIAGSYSTYQIDAVCLVLGPNNEVVRISHWKDLGSEMV